jgi:cytochrome c553
MRHLLLALLAFLVACFLVAGCEQAPAPKAAGPKGDVAAGKAFADGSCKGCHGLDGKGIAPAIPHLAAQREGYLLAALQEYKAGKRSHAALKDIATRMSDADARNIAAFYASLPPLPSSGQAGELVSPYERGKTLAEPCTKCHGADGNSPTAGMPSLAGQHPGYLVVAAQEYLNRERKSAAMHGVLPSLKKRDLEAIALFFASQQARERGAPAFGDAKAGEPLTAVCGGCHGAHGLSADGNIPTLAGQEPKYLVAAIKAYRTTRNRESMREYVRALSDRDIENIAAFYSVQVSRPAEKGQTLVQELSDKCERCHSAAAAAASSVPVPKIDGQDRDYLIMALRAYRDDRRESTTMHRMSLPYSDSVIESLAAAYAAQPAK